MSPLLAFLLFAFQPPVETGDFLPSDLVELVRLDPTIKLDVRYASTNNFLGKPVYKEARAFLQRPAAEGLVRAHRWLKDQGYGIVVHDGYRPWAVTKLFWDMTPPAKRDFVANPAKGSKHNRGCAADISLYELKTGHIVEMTSGYDEMSERAYPDYTGGTPEQRRLRDLLRSAMEKQGFMVYEYEWWHFDYKDWRKYRIGTASFQELSIR
jgi:D-alanyl-D-alanine dipeptidase